ncbi:serine/threonine-protein kinase [Amycolatopsis nigrescens]|uniref:serine/threonine-protein kinase n=1 Tax=Amycolatopsis nigrescens TaxID=381445 RepID=UPI0012F9CA58|nr:serine/threonine-protein kinase [Amycolatopsis nigrescens]
MVVKLRRGGDPRRIGRYRVIRQLGVGGMGAVYLASGKDGRSVAVKVIRAEHAANPVFRARFRREVAAAQRVRPFCTAPIIDADPDANPPYLVTEFVNGPSLHDHVATSGPLRGADLEALAVGVVAALTAIHDAGVVHRDLKPANVLLSPFGPRVIDFGIARVTDLTRLSVDGAVMGTPAFMAPEQVRAEQVTTAADVFAWGGVVAFAARGEPPFRGESTAAALHQILTGEPGLGGLDGALRDQVLAAMSKTPERRPTAHDILGSLISSGTPAPAEVPDVEAPRAAPSGADPAEVSYRRAAEAGDATAMHDLADLLRKSYRTEEAEHWYRKAIDAGAIFAPVNLGLLYDQRGELDEAEHWYRKAVDNGVTAAMANLGALHEKRGQLDEAERWYRKAADAGFAGGMGNLGLLLQHRGDNAGAEHWYRQAADAGDTWAVDKLNNLLRRGAEESH